MKGNEYLGSILSAEQRTAGLSLREDDHCVVLLHEGIEVAKFTVNATVESLLYEAEQYMNRQKCWISFV